jgi:hypothetical protein
VIERDSVHGYLQLQRHALYRHHGKHSLEVVTIDLQNIVDTTKPAGPSAFEFHHWMTFVESNERQALTLRFVEEWAGIRDSRRRGEPGAHKRKTDSLVRLENLWPEFPCDVEADFRPHYRSKAHGGTPGAACTGWLPLAGKKSDGQIAAKPRV